MSRLAALKKVLVPSHTDIEYQRMPDVALRDLSTPDQGVFTDTAEHGTIGSHTESRLHRFVTNHSWLLHPTTTKQKVWCFSLWAAVAGGLIALFVFLFPKLVDNVIEPATELLQAKLTPVEIALVAIAAMAVLPVFFVTHTPFIWLSALVLGFWRALLVVEIGTMLGVSLTFLLGKTLLHRPALRVVQRYEKVRAVLLAIDKAGAFKVVLLMRLGPVPYSVMNYICSIPHSVAFPAYFLASFVGLLPYNILEIYLGHNIHGIAGDLPAELTTKPCTFPLQASRDFHMPAAAASHR
jgi:uncharacterized membrane protein YdjX (TVP38/TMEM64 family)